MNFLNDKILINQIDNVAISGLTTQLISFCVNDIYKRNNKNILIVTNSLYEANIYYSSISKLNNNVYLFPMDDFLTSESLAISPELKSIRVNTLNELSENDHNIVITNLMGFLRYLPSKKLWMDSKIILKKDTEVNKDELFRKLLSIGYVSDTIVNKTGEVSNRGYILDVFSSNNDNPIRLEFWGDTLDSIRYFDVESQRSLEEINECEIRPYSEFINEKMVEDIPDYQKYLPYVVNEVSSLLSYVDDPLMIYKDYNQIKKSYKRLREEIFEYSSSKEEEYKTEYMHDFSSLEQKNNNIYLMTIDNVTDIKSINKTYNYSSRLPEKFESNFKYLNEYLEKQLYSNKIVIIALSDESKLKNIEKYLTVSTILTNENDLSKGKVNIINSNLDEGFEFDNYVVLTENELFKNRDKKTNYKNKFKYGSKIKDIDNLKVGDYVVHLNHGIGMYTGIKTLTKNGNKKDYIEVSYKDNDKLYIPVEKIDLITKYSSNEGVVPRLNKLGGSEWQKTKLRVKNKVKDIADKLIKISAERKLQKGFAFKKDDELSKEFDSEFKYEPTVDQYIAIERIKSAMEKEYPMDMLLCGDVGFGKTEVALRGAFKAILDHKQVAFLCPTTILSMQHFKTATERFKNFPVEIALLNRFTSSKEKKRILKEVKEGKIDLLIGTHRILSKDVAFNDLGLLVIDEEQRFGVKQKEKIKEYRETIDVLSLSATPIPRTLQMSLMGIRGLSKIDTPPKNRLPVQTYVVEKNNTLIKQVIERELARDGQVFYLYNRTDQIANVAYKISSTVPNAKVAIGHGQMDKNELEDVMLRFMNKEFNVLICTTIIETGIDIPNANTMIVEDADKFGLAQLYQIRGRVGRSERGAYAYLLYKKDKSIQDDALKRLKAIKEFTELGSGYKIAMLDLSIRGSGDILGGKQAGFIDDIGFEMYMKILQDAINVRMHKDEKPEEEVKNLNVSVDGYIPDDYVESDYEKLELYQRLDKAKTMSELNSLKAEFDDYYGNLPEAILTLIEKRKLEILSHYSIIEDIKDSGKQLEIIFSPNAFETISGDKLFLLANQLFTKPAFKSLDNKITIKINKHDRWLNRLNEFIETLSKK